MSDANVAQGNRRRRRKRNLYIGRFAAIHLLCLAAFWTGITWTAVALFAGLYALRMFAVTAGYHRYFSHRTYKLSRVGQFVMGFLAESSAQKGVLWWASHHRHHHTHSDEPDDVHSPSQHGFWYAHLGWIFDPDWADTEDKRVKDLSRYSELVWLDRWHMIPPTVLGVATYLVGGWSGFIVGFVWSTVLCWHSTFTINSLAHVIGGQRYETDDQSRNHLGLALLTFGEGWHNNHHHYQASAAQGFYWWEVDLTYYVLKVLEWVGIVEDLRTPPEHVIADEPHPAARASREDASSGEEGDAGGDDQTRDVIDTEYWGGQVEAIRLSASRAQRRASKHVRSIGLAATRQYEELSDQASRRAEGALERVDDIRQSAQRAHEEAEKQVDRIIVESLSKPNPETT